MSQMSADAHTSQFQQLFYERMRYNKQLQYFDCNILTADAFKKSIAAELKLTEDSEQPSLPKTHSMAPVESLNLEGNEDEASTVALP